MWVPSLGWEDPLEKGMATHSSIQPREFPCTKEPGRLQSIGSQRVNTRLKWLSSGVLDLIVETGMWLIESEN